MGNSFFGLEVPFLDLLDARAEHCEEGRALVSLEVRPELTNSWKAAHGAVVMALLDAAMGMAARSANGQAGGVVTVEISVNFLRSAAGRLAAEGWVLHNGRSLVFCEGEVRDESGDLLAKALGTFKLRHRKE
jgi:uncharacterized protein (TIGR00369 family)